VAPLPADGFCGLSTAAELGPVPTQTLTNGSTEAVVHAVTTESVADTSEVFKRLYDECSTRGRVDSREGPALYWSAADPGGPPVPRAARWDGTTLFLLSARASGGPLPDVPGLVAALRAP